MSLPDLTKFSLNRGKVRLLAENRFIENPQDLEEEFEKVGKRPDLPSWQKFIRFNLLLSSVIFLLAGVIFFVAANWLDLDPFYKLGLLVAAVLVTALSGVLVDLKSILGKMSMLLSCLLIGPTLALFGQIYQTGADSYELFLGWALLMIPFLFLVYFSGLLFFWLFLLNLAFVLWSSIFVPPPQIFISPLILLWPLANLLIWAAWEVGYWRRFNLTTERSFARIYSFLFLIPALCTSIFLLFLNQDTFRFIFGQNNPNLSYIIAVFVLFLLILGGMIFAYSKLIPDFFMLCLAVLCAGILACFGFGRVIFLDLEMGSEGALLQGIIILAVTAVCIKIVLRLQKSLPEEKNNLPTEAK